MTYSPPGTITGAGTANTICKFTAASVIGNSLITDDATTVTIATRTTLHAAVDVNNAQQFLTVTGTLPATPNVNVAGTSITVISNGAAAHKQYATEITLGTGFTGAADSAALHAVSAVNSSNGSNYGIFVENISGGVNQVNVGVGAFVQNGVGQSIGFASNVNTAGTYGIGVLGRSQAGTTGRMGGLFSLATGSTITPPSVSASLVADNSAIALPIFLALDNGVTKVAVADGGSLNLSAGTIWPISTKIANYPLTDQDITILADASALAITMTLPNAALHTGRMFNIKKIDATANAVTVASAGGLIDGLATQTITAQWDSFTLQSNGTDWFII